MIEKQKVKDGWGEAISQHEEGDFFHYAIVCLFGLQCGWFDRSQVDCSCVVVCYLELWSDF